MAAALAAYAPLPAGAAPAPSPADSPPPKLSNGGVVEGQVTSVDYQRGIIAVLARGGRKMEVTVLPSTSIQGSGAGYHSIAEIRRGEHVQIFTSVADGKWTAQIIKLMH